MERRMTESTEVLAFAGYKEFEAAADRTAVKIKEGFMEMGCILKMAKETDILRQSPYADVEDFAKKRYDLEKSVVSRYIRIVKRFSVDGDSAQLKDSYKNMGFSKLSLMLNMPDEVAEELMDSLSKTEVLAIKEEIDEENAVTDMELAIEKADLAEDGPEESLLAAAVRELGKEQEELYRKLWKACREERKRDLRDILAPQGDQVYMVRIPGTGRIMLAISGESVSATAVRSGEKEKGTMEELLKVVENLCPAAGMEAEEAFYRVYGKEMEKPKEPEKPREPERQQAAPKKRKETKVVVAKTKKNSRAAGVKTPDAQEEAEETEKEEQLPGQMNAYQYPELIPEGMPIPESEAESHGSEAPGPEIPGMKIPGMDIPAVVPFEAGPSGAVPFPGNQTEEEIWTETSASLQSLSRDFYTRSAGDLSGLYLEYVEEMYKKAVDVAAGLEKVMIVRRRADGKEHNA